MKKESDKNLKQNMAASHLWKTGRRGLFSMNPILAAVAIFVAFFCLTTVTIAWFSSMYFQEETMNFTTGTTPPINAKMWMYTTSLEGEPGWVEQTITYRGVDEDEIYVPKVVTTKNESGTVTQVVPVTLHLGTINNLVNISDDNITYFRFEIDAAEQGKDLTFEASQPKYTENTQYNIIVYDQNGTEIDPDNSLDKPILNTIEDINEREPFIVYDYFISDQELSPTNFTFDPGKDGFERMTPVEGADKNHYKISRNVDYTGKYYLYIRISPNMSSFGESASTLYGRNFIPYIMMFKWDWMIEVK